MEYIMREMEATDFEECAKIIREGFSTVAKEFGLTYQNCPTNGAFIQGERLLEEKEKGHIMYGMMVDNRIIGYMQLEKTSQELYFLQKLVVLPTYRHMGLGTHLLDFAVEKVAEWGGSCISIGIIEENTILKNWYLDYGFIHIGTRKFAHLPFTVGFMEIYL